jgi:hypothetical protein
VRPWGSLSAALGWAGGGGRIRHPFPGRAMRCARWAAAAGRVRRAGLRKVLVEWVGTSFPAHGTLRRNRCAEPCSAAKTPRRIGCSVNAGIARRAPGTRVSCRSTLTASWARRAATQAGRTHTLGGFDDAAGSAARAGALSPLGERPRYRRLRSFRDAHRGAA